MQRHFARMESMTDIGRILAYGRKVCIDMGVLRQTYHFPSLFDDISSGRTVIYQDGYPEEWQSLYSRIDFRQHDPTPQRTIDHGKILSYAEAAKLGANTSEQDAFFDSMRKYGLEHSFGVPLYGPRGRNGFAAFDFGRPLEVIDDQTIGAVRSIAQAAHQRICVLIEQTDGAPELSRRESEVLGWIAQGKSNTDIATILGLSPDTVRTYAKRIFEKLGVSDRVGAAIKALKLGLISV